MLSGGPSCGDRRAKITGPFLGLFACLLQPIQVCTYSFAFFLFDIVQSCLKQLNDTI